jgi:hypothetical protein
MKLINVEKQINKNIKILFDLLIKSYFSLNVSLITSFKFFEALNRLNSAERTSLFENVSGVIKFHIYSSNFNKSFLLLDR